MTVEDDFDEKGLPTRVDNTISSLEKAWTGTEYTGQSEDFSVAVRYCHLFFATFLRNDLQIPPIMSRKRELADAVAGLDLSWQGEKYVGEYKIIGEPGLTDARLRTMHTALVTIKAAAIKKGFWTS